MFNQLADRISFLDTRNKLLTSAVSHDLRTPISAMEFSLALMQSSDGIKDRRRHLNNLSQYLDTLNILSVQLQTYAKFDRHEVLLVKQKLVIAHWITQYIATFEKAQNIELNIDQQLSSLVVSFDPDYLSRVIDNVLSNNLRYAHSIVRVSMQLIAERKQLQIIIENDGTAIEKENRQNIFEPFVRLDESRSDDTEGSGLGLAIVRQIMHWHKGDVSAEHSHLGGAKFILTLPIE
jgi:two-component system OmpR family sensor kinase